MVFRNHHFPSLNSKFSLFSFDKDCFFLLTLFEQDLFSGASPGWSNWCAVHLMTHLWRAMRQISLSLLPGAPLALPAPDCSDLRRSSLHFLRPEQSKCSVPTAHVWKLWTCAVDSEHCEPTVHACSFQICTVGAEHSDCSTSRRTRLLLLGAE